MKTNFILLSGLFMVACVSGVATDSREHQALSRYTFSWPLTDSDALQPRGGDTRGPAVTLDKSPSREWLALQEKDLPPLERDRRAILAMAGTYRVSFDFLEVVPLSASDKPQRPYQSWGTEKVYVDEDQHTSISLVHILEMRIVQTDGTLSAPMVTKHWRQDWRYQPTRMMEYAGRDQWTTRRFNRSDVRGTWSQTVYQVDESPRYAGIGRWKHSASLSIWSSIETWRPLPRREWSVRSDYHVLAGTNRHSIVPSGWVQEENNLKLVLTDKRLPDPEQPYLAREYGVARYERIRDAPFSDADRYYQRTKTFWQQVRQAWSEAFAKHGTITLRGPVDQLGLFKPLFERADDIAESAAASPADDESRLIIEAALKDMGVADWHDRKPDTQQSPAAGDKEGKK